MNDGTIEVMEADSTTTADNDNKRDANLINCDYFFLKEPRNVKWYQDNVATPLESGGMHQLVTSLQRTGILASEMTCFKDCNTPNICRRAKVVDGCQWHCDKCNKNRSVREYSLFKNFCCKLSDAMRIISAWSEDMDENIVATVLDVKPRLVYNLYLKLDTLAASEQCMTRLGGSDSAVLIDLYPQTPPYTVLMVTDTKHVPPKYWLQALTVHPGSKTENNNVISKRSQKTIEKTVCMAASSVMSSIINPGGSCVIGTVASAVKDLRDVIQASQKFTDIRTIDELENSCSADLLNFLKHDVWSQALLICAASIEGDDRQKQRYLNASLYRLRHNVDGFLQQVIDLIVARRTTFN